MFGSNNNNPFVQSSSSPFGSPSVFGVTSSPSANPFGSSPFGNSNPFAAQSGSSTFGGTSTGVFGQSSTPAFGASSSPAFGSSTPAFGASSSPAFGSSTPAFGATPAFGSASSSFGSNSIFGQKPAFGRFGSTPTQSSPFGSTFQQSQPAFGSTTFGSTTFGAQSQPAFGTSNTPAFGATATTTTPAFGASSTPTFGASTTPAFGSTSTSWFGNTGSAFGVSSTPAFGSTFGTPGTSLFGASSTPAFGASSTPAFGASSTPAFGASSTPAFGASSYFSFGSAFGKSASTFGSTTFQSTPSPFGAQSSPFGAQTTTPSFGSSGFGQTGLRTPQVGTRVVPYSTTQETDAGGTTLPEKLTSISAMPAYKGKSHEELRWEDYQRGDKGGPNQTGQSATANPLGSTNSAFSQPAATLNPFSATTPSNPFAPKTPAFGSSPFGISSSSPFSSTFGASSSNPFGSTTSTPLFGTTSNTAFHSASSSPSLFGGTANTFGSSPSLFGSTFGTTSTFNSGLNFGNTQTSGLFQSSSPSLGQSISPFGQATGFQQTPSAFGSTPHAFGSTPAFGSNLFGTQSTGFGGSLFSSSASVFSTSNPSGLGQTTPSFSTPFQSAPAQSSGAFSFSNFGQTQQAPSTGFGGTSNIFNPGTFGQGASPQPNMVMQPTPIINPFGTLPSIPQMSVGHMGSNIPSGHYGISSMPVIEKPMPARICSLMFPRHISQRRIMLPARKYHPKVDGERVPFFSDDDVSTSATPKTDALFIPRENPKSLLIRSIEPCPSMHSKHHMETLVVLKDSPVNRNGKLSIEPSAPVLDESSQDYHDGGPNGNSNVKENHGYPSSSSSSKSTTYTNGSFHDSHAVKDSDNSYIKNISGHRAGEAAIAYEHGAGIEALMPKLRHSDYYTEPRIQELAAKERAEPGFCRGVKDFTVGRHGYGSIKFFGEADVRRLELESVVQFNNREVTVYGDEKKKPGIGQGLNKPAEVTLLNVKCINKKTGEQYMNGAKIEKYKEMLIKKAEEQGAEFVSYDPVKGEWKFRVDHFSSYRFGDGDGDGDVYFL